MAYIESQQTLGRHPKTRKAARLLSVSIPTIIGHLHLLWHWALDFAQSGDLSPYDEKEVADAAMWTEDADQFIEALVNAGFLDGDDGTLTIHDWYDYAGRLIERREQNAQRMRDARAARERQCAENVQRTSVARAGATVPNRTLPDQTVPKPIISKREYDADFTAFYAAYPKHENKKAAYDYWRRLRPDAALFSTIMAAIERQKKGRKWIEGYANAPDVWLKGAKWEDEPEPLRAPPTRGQPVDAARYAAPAGGSIRRRQAE
jgi:hypothetical protein